MSALDQDHRSRLGALYGAGLDPSVSERHLQSIDAEIAEPSTAQRVRNPRRRRAPAVAFAAALVVVLPLAGAVASESAVPGDVLYPVKLATEQAVGIVVPDLVARHRIEELELLLDRQASDDAVSEATDRASQAVTDRPSDDPLVRRLDELLARTGRETADDRVGDDAGDREPTGDDRPPDGEPFGREPSGGSPEPPSSSTTTAPPDRVRDTTTTTVEETGRTDRSTTTTTEASRSDGTGSDGETQDEPPSDRGGDRDG